MSIKSKIVEDRIPAHVAIIMDGNGRWANLMGKPRIFGHENGVHAVRASLEAAVEVGVKCLTLYAFSTENWKRPDFEINALMTLLVRTVRKEVDALDKEGVRLSAIGDLDRLPGRTRKALLEATEKTKHNSTIDLVLALNYSARWDLVNAAKNAHLHLCTHQADSNTLNECQFAQFLSTAKYPELELLIRTSGEKRLSNFLLWEAAYAELHFTEKFWPEFRKDDFFKAIVDFQSRERRFGLTGDQLKV